MKYLRGLAGAVVFGFGVAALAGPAQFGPRLDVAVVDQSKLAVPGVRVEIRSAPAAPIVQTTAETGKVTFADLQPGRYHLTVVLAGFENIERDLDLRAEAPVSVELTLMPKLERTKIDVSGEVSPVEEGSAPATIVHAQVAKELPSRPETVADTLPLVPGVVRDPGGALHISDAGEHRSALIVNSADVTDPATGQFGLTVPIDSVEAVNVFQTAFQAEYGRFTAGLVSVETRRGGDKWKWELNDPLPEFRIRSWELRGLKTATPRLNFEGPLIANRLYFSEGVEYVVRKTAVYTLPFPRNQKLETGINSFSQLDWVASNRHLVTATFHFAPERLGHVNMDFYNPEETTPDATLHNYTGTVFDKLTLGSSLLENTFSVGSYDLREWPKGGQDLSIAPWGNSGNYFGLKNRSATRLSGLSVFSFSPVKGAGDHHVKVGTYVAGSFQDGQLEQFPVNIVNAAGVTTETIGFTRPRQFEISDVESNFFVQDHWIVSPRLSLDLGTRVESQQVSGAQRLAPRVGFAWNPFKELGTTVRGGAGYFYDRVPLNVYCFNKYPDQVLTYFDASGEVTAGPYLYLNTLGQVKVRHPFVFQEPKDGNFSPRSTIWMLQVEQPAGHNVRLRAGYLENVSDGLVTLDPVAPDPDTGLGAYLLSGTGASRYRQLEATAKVRVGKSGEMLFSYVRAQGRGDLNDFASFLGAFPVPVIRPNEYGTLPADLPNRFLAWGLLQLPARFQVAPVVEYRSGFPYSVLNAEQQYAGIPNGSRFPRFLSIDARISKDIQVDPKYGVRLSVSAFNLTNHFNPEAVRNNIADPACGYFFGHRGRRFTVDFDVLF